MRRQRVKAFGNGTGCFRHSVSIIGPLTLPGKQHGCRKSNENTLL
jgi:hypothetical protein